jgi:hypothetical protein
MSFTSPPVPSQPRRHWPIRLATLALLTAAAQAPAFAATSATGSGYTGITNIGGTLQTPLDITTGTQPQYDSSVTGTGQTVGHLGDGSITATAGVAGSAQASYGSLHAQVSGNLQADSPSPADDPFLRGDFRASFDDVLIVSSNSLAIGTPVTLQMTMSVDAVITHNTGALIYVSYQLGNASGQVVNIQRGSLTYSGLPPQVYAFSYPFTFNDVVGDSLHLSSVLQVGINQSFSGESYQFGPLEGSYIYNQPSVDASHTSTVFVDSLTPGVTLVAASGHDYSTAAAVPEPATASLVLLGLAVVTTTARRRASRRA